MRLPSTARNCLFQISFALSCASCGDAHLRQSHRTAADTCPAAEVRRQHLRFEDGAEVYIAPGTLARSGQQYFLGGTPNYVFMRSADGRGVLIGRDSVLGAVFSDGQAHAVPSPIGMHRAALVKAAGRKDGGWDVVFGEREAPSVETPNVVSPRVVRLWYGLYKDRRWHSLEQLPVPPNADLAGLSATGVSELARGGERLAWAVAADIAGSLTKQALLFERIGNQWHAETIETGTGSYLSLAYLDTTATLVLAAVRADGASLSPGESDRNSLFLWTRAGAWSEPHRMVLGREQGEVHGPVLTQSGTTGLTWVSPVGEDYELRAIPDIRYPDSVFFVSAGLPHLRAFAPVTVNGETVWLSLQGSPEKSIRITGLSQGSRLRAHAVITDPFVASFRATGGSRSGQVQLAGGVGVPERNTVSTLLLTVQLGCMEQPLPARTPALHPTR